MSDMTLSDVLRCMQSYISDEDLCRTCPKKKTIEVDGSILLSCEEVEAHKIAAELIQKEIMNQNKTVVKLGGNN